MIRVNHCIRSLSRATSIAGYVMFAFGPPACRQLFGGVGKRVDVGLSYACGEVAAYAFFAGLGLATLSAALTAALPKHHLRPLTGFVVADVVLLPFALLPPVV